MIKKRIFLSIPLVIAAAFLIYCWAILLSTTLLANWRHYVALLLFLPLIYFYFKSYKWALVGTGIYLLLGTFNILSLTAAISSWGLTIGTVDSTSINLISLALLILFVTLNFSKLIEIYVDYTEARHAKKMGKISH